MQSISTSIFPNPKSISVPSFFIKNLTHVLIYCFELSVFIIRFIINAFVFIARFIPFFFLFQLFLPA
jgi:hypothetical protein